jgi:predicted HTH domain antitoxin
MVHMTIDMPEEALASLRTDSEDFVRQLRLAAAVKWYELRRVTQERAAKIAGLSRAVSVHCGGGVGGSRP